MYSVREAARRLGVTIRTVRDWISKGKIIAVKDKNGWNWLISEDEIERIVNGYKD